MKKKYLIIILVFYMLLSIINIFSYHDLLIKQILFFIVGFIILFVVKNKIIKYIFPIYILFNCLLLYLLIFGKSVNGSKAWFYLFGVSLQPSEFMKIILIIYLSIIVFNNEKYYLKSFIITLIPSILTFLEPDTGNVIFYFVILFSIIFYKEKRKLLFIIPIVSLIILFSIFFYIYFFNNNLFINIFGSSFFYRVDRILSLFDNSSYQLNRALIAIGSSSLFGIRKTFYIPEETTDFAFSLLTSRIGFVGIIIYLIVNFIFNYTFLSNNKSYKAYYKYIVFSFLCLKIMQESIHILMNIGLFPITGITLPFISCGGSSLLSYFIILGIISNCNSMEDNYKA